MHEVGERGKGSQYQKGKKALPFFLNASDGRGRNVAREIGNKYLGKKREDGENRTLGVEVNCGEHCSCSISEQVAIPGSDIKGRLYDDEEAR